MKWEKKKILILVKTYPSPSTKYHEVACTAGITSDGELIRLYPIMFRYLDDSQKFEKYRWIEADIQKSPSDNRPESYRVNYDSIRLLDRLDSQKDYMERRKWVMSLVSRSQEDIMASHEKSGITLGIFKPLKVSDLIVEETTNKDWTSKEKALLSQINLYDRNLATLEKIPYDFSFIYRCNNPDCKGHKMKSTDWELCQSYRNFKLKYGLQKGIEILKNKWIGIFNNEKTDTFFIVGTVHRWKTFILIGYIDIKKEDNYTQLNLF